jgi:PAS domain S-box-containing protein
LPISTASITPGCIAIEWLDPKYEERWVSRSQGEKVPPVGNETRARLLQSAKESHQATLSNLLLSPTGRKQWLAVVPIYQKDRFRGFVLGYFDAQRSLDTMFVDIIGLNYSVAIAENGVEGYRLAGSTAENREKWAQNIQVPLPGATWQLQVWPKPEAMLEMTSILPLMTIIFGFGAGLLLIVIAKTIDKLRIEVAERRKVEESLRGSQARFAGILEISAEGVISTDANQRITLYNHAAETIFGYTADEARGQSLELLIPERFRAIHLAHVSQFARSGTSSLHMADRRRVLGLRKDGREFHMAASVSKLEIAGRNIFTIICSDVTHEVLAEEELRRARDELELRVRERTAELETSNQSLQSEIAERKQAEEEIQDLSRRMMRVQDEERRNLARELHDGTTQQLVALSLNIARIRDMALERAAAHATLTECLQLVEQCTNELRTVSYLLHPPLLEEMGLRLTFCGYVDGFAGRSGIAITMDTSGDLEGLGIDVELAVFRIAQEALSNIHRHSHSRTATIRLAREGGELSMEIADQGSGIPTGMNGGGVGMASMRERVRLLKGRIEIKTGASGTAITVHLPLADLGRLSTQAIA